MSVIWIDGKYIEKENATIPALSQTVHYGFGVYEGLRSYKTSNGTAIFRLEDHTDRLFQSAGLLHIKIPYSKDELNDVQQEIIQKNNFDNAYIRPMVFMGDEFLGLHTQISSVHVMIATIQWNNFFITKEKIKKGIALKTSTHERLPLKNSLTKAKANGMYMISILANNEARVAGFDEALMLDPNGFVAEGSGANIFMMKNNCLYTPFLDFALDGITRRTVMQIAADLHINVAEKNITRDDLYEADEVFFTGTAAEVLAITKIDNHIIATGEMGNITEKIQQRYNDIVIGKDARYLSWLTFNKLKIPSEI